MPFSEQRAALSAQLEQMERLLRQAHNLSREMEERAEAAAGETESFADDTVVARAGAAAKRARQDLDALLRTVAATRGQLGD